MNLQQLKFAQAVASTHSFSKAAQSCHVTQPTLSNAIAQLEKELGGRLFSRTTRKVALTAFGEYLLPYIAEVLQSREELTQAAASFRNPSHKIIRIGISPLVDMPRLDQALAPFRESHPDVSFFFKECFLDELSNRIQTEQIDFEIRPARQGVASETTCFFYRDPLYYLPASTEESEIKHLSFKVSELPDTPVILTGGGCGLNDALSALFSTQGISLKAYLGQALTYRVIEDWTSLGIGAGILPKAKLSTDIQHAFPLFLEKDTAAMLDYEWVWNAKRDMPDYLNEFIDYIRDTVPALTRGQVQKSGQVSL